MRTRGYRLKQQTETAVDRGAPWIKGLMWRKVQWGLHLCKEVRTERGKHGGGVTGGEAKEGGAFCLHGSKEAVRTLTAE